MPCWEVNILSVEFSGRSIELLKAIGARQVGDNLWEVDGVEIDLVEGTATGSQRSINAVKRRYSEAAVRKAAKVNRWSVSKKAARKFQAIKY